jgi:hypothetical protein
MSTDRLNRLTSPPIVPNVEGPVLRRGKDMLILAVILDLGGTGNPITEAQDGLSWSAEVPAMDISVNSACCE